MSKGHPLPLAQDAPNCDKKTPLLWVESVHISAITGRAFVGARSKRVHRNCFENPRPDDHADCPRNGGMYGETHAMGPPRYGPKPYGATLLRSPEWTSYDHGQHRGLRGIMHYFSSSPPFTVIWRAACICHLATLVHTHPDMHGNGA